MEFASAPSQASLTALLEFPVPAPLVSILTTFWEASQQSGQSLNVILDDLCGFYLEGYESRYQQTPPELFPIGRTGVDGVHYGYVLHAPEHPEEDYPLAQFGPMDFEGVVLLGRTTQNAFEWLLSFHPRVLGNAQERVQLARSIAQKAGLSLSPGKVGARYGEQGQGLPVEPRVRPEEQHVMTTDGVGVLAARNLFRPDDSFDGIASNTTMNRILDRAKGELEAGYPATALLYLREGYWHDWTETGAILRYGTLMQRAYEDLRRPILAHVVERRIKKFA